MEHKKPKRPKNPFFKFKDEVFQEYLRKYPELKGIQVVPLIAKDFKQLPKEKLEEYNRVYQSELNEYRRRVAIIN